MERIFTYHITENTNKTIRDYLLSKGFSKQNIINLKKIPESILLNGKWEYVSKKLTANDVLCIHLLEEEANENIVPVPLDFPILYEDEDILVVNKPANMPTHPSLHNYDNTLANAAAYYFKAQNIPYTFRCINRLDKDTTGLTILAKHMISAGLLSNMIKDRFIKREYLAIVNGNLPCDSGTIDAPIGRVSDSLITREVNFLTGERAITHYRVLSSNADYALVSLHLETGRTHQIRVHMAYMGCPLVGDYLYHPAYANSQTASDASTLPLEMHRQALHAYRLDFSHPITQKPLTFQAELPSDMKHLCEILNLHYNKNPIDS